MNLKTKNDKAEAYYRKLILLNKVTNILSIENKKYIFEQGYCWDLLFKDEDAAEVCYYYARHVLKKAFPEGEPYIAKSPWYAYHYAVSVLDGRFPLGERVLFNSDWKENYLYFLDNK